VIHRPHEFYCYRDASFIIIVIFFLEKYNLYDGYLFHLNALVFEFFGGEK